MKDEINNKIPENNHSEITNDAESPSTVEDVRSKPPNFFLRIIPLVLGALTFVISLTIYYGTTCPVIYYGDAGELITAAYNWGIAHPPGYPAYIILLGIWVRLPLRLFAPDTEFYQHIAWQANFFSAFLGSLTILTVYMIILRVTKLAWISFAGALLIAIGRTFWSQTGIAEVYTLNSLLLAIMVLIGLLQSDDPPGSRSRLIKFRWISVIWGLSLANHHEAVFMFPIWLTSLVLAMQPCPEKKRPCFPHPRTIIEGIGFLIIGLLPYLYLPIAASTDPVLNWGNPSNLRNFIKVLTRSEYRQIKEMISGDLVTSFDILLKYLYWSLIQYPWIYLALAIPGLFGIFKRSKLRPILVASFISITLMSCSFIIYFAGIDRPSMFFMEVYFIPWYIALGALITIGIPVLISLIRDFEGPLKHGIFGITFVILISGFTFGYALNHSTADMSDNIHGYVYAHDILETLPSQPEKHVLITGGDEIFLFWYWKWVEGTEKDIACIGMDALGVENSWFWDDLAKDHPALIIPTDRGFAQTYQGDELRVKMLETLMRDNNGSYRFWMTAWDPALQSILYEKPWHWVMDGPSLELERDSEGNISDYVRASTPEDQYLFTSLLDVSRDGLAPFEEEIYDRYAATCYNLADFFTRNDFPEEAIKFIETCLRLRPGYTASSSGESPIDLIGRNLTTDASRQLARTLVDSYIEIDPTNSRLYYVSGKIERTDGDPEKGIELLEEAIVLELGKADDLRVHAEGLYNSGDISGATHELEIAARRVIRTSLYHAEIADILVDIGETNAALDRLEIALEIDPGNTWIKAIYDKLAGVTNGS